MYKLTFFALLLIFLATFSWLLLPTVMGFWSIVDQYNFVKFEWKKISLFAMAEVFLEMHFQSCMNKMATSKKLNPLYVTSAEWDRS